MTAPIPSQALPVQRLMPNLGSFGITMRIVFMAQTIALIVAIARNPVLDGRAWNEFTLLSLFTFGVALLSALVLKALSGLIARSTEIVGSIVVLFLLLAVILFGNEALVYLLHRFGYIAERWPEWHLSMLVRTSIVGAIIGTLGLRYLILQHRARMDARLEQEARMQALQSRIRPHFLFNSMNSIASLTRSDPARAEAALQDLADLFRVLLADARKLVPISAEREITRQYLEIEKLRLGDRLKISWSVNNIPRTALVPALTLQPLLENAIYHGIEPRFGGGTVRIELWTEGEALCFLISNPLPEVPKHAHGKGNKIAMENIRQRLATHFGENASMQAFEEGGQYHVKVKMPIVKG